MAVPLQSKAILPYPNKTPFLAEVKQKLEVNPADSFDQWLATANCWAVEGETSTPLLLRIPEYRDLCRIRQEFVKQGKRFRSVLY